MSEEFEWSAERTKDGTRNVAVLRYGEKVVVRVFTNPDGSIIRTSYAELEDASQVRIDVANKLIDFRRKIA